MKQVNLLWIITVVNSVVLIIIILVFIASLTYPAQSESKELREWVQKQIDENVNWVKKELDNNVEFVNKAIKEEHELNEVNTKKIFDYVNSR